MGKYSLYLVSLLALFVMTSCERRPLEDENTPGYNAQIPIQIDWSQSGLDMDNSGTRKHRASVWVFNKERSGEYFEFRLENSLTEATLPLAVGHYAMLVFNETIDAGDWEALEFAGTESYDAFRITTRPDTENRIYGRSESDEELRKAPDALAVWSLDEFEVTEAMVDLTRSRAASKSAATKSTVDLSRAEQRAAESELEKVMSITPTMITKPLQIKVYVHNLSSSTSAAGVIKGMARGIYMASRELVEGDPVAHSFTLNGRQYDPDSPKDGTTECLIYVFGTQGTDEGTYTVQLDFLLNDGTTVPSEVFDVTEQVENPTPDGEIIINVGSKDPDKPADPDKPDDPDRPIILPGDVEGNVGVDDWNNKEIIIK